MANRRQVIAQNIRAGRANGGTTAPNRSGGSSGSGGTSYPGPGIGKGRSTGIGLAGNRKATAVGLGQNQPAQAPAANPVTPAQPSPMPWDAAAANSEAGAQKKLANTLTGLDSGWLRTQQDYGLEGSWADAASNPYSRSALLQRSYDNAKRGTLNSAGHKLYSGSYVNNQNANTHQFSMGRDELEKAYAEANANYVGQRAQAGDQFQEELNQAGWNRVNAGLAEEPEPAASPQAKSKPKTKKNPAVGQGRKAVIAQNISKGRRAK